MPCQRNDVIMCIVWYYYLLRINKKENFWFLFIGYNGPSSDPVILISKRFWNCTNDRCLVMSKIWRLTRCIKELKVIKEWKCKLDVTRSELKKINVDFIMCYIDLILHFCFLAWNLLRGSTCTVPKKLTIFSVVFNFFSCFLRKYSLPRII